MGDTRWPVGELEVQNLLDQGELEEVAPSPEHAELLMRQAAARAVQGLRATSRNGHRATQEAVEAQVGPNARRVVRPFRGLRLRRHEAEYPSLETPAITADEVRDAWEDATSMVEAMQTFLPNLRPW